MSGTPSIVGPATKLRAQLAKMFDLIDELLAQSVQAADDNVDLMEIQIDQIAREILSLEGLSDEDRRLVITANMVNTDLERIGGHATNIAESVVFWIEGVDVRRPNLHQGDSASGAVRLDNPSTSVH